MCMPFIQQCSMALSNKCNFIQIYKRRKLLDLLYLTALWCFSAYPNFSKYYGSFIASWKWISKINKQPTPVFIILKRFHWCCNYCHGGEGKFWKDQVRLVKLNFIIFVMHLNVHDKILFTSQWWVLFRVLSEDIVHLCYLPVYKR